VWVNCVPFFFFLSFFLFFSGSAFSKFKIAQASSSQHWVFNVCSIVAYLPTWSISLGSAGLSSSSLLPPHYVSFFSLASYFRSTEAPFSPLLRLAKLIRVYFSLRLAFSPFLLDSLHVKSSETLVVLCAISPSLCLFVHRLLFICHL